MMAKGNGFVVLVFSKDRALQCDLLLRSLKEYCIDINDGKTVVLYTTTSNEQEDSYKILIEEHLAVKFLEEKDFYNDVMEYLRSNKYVMFLTDDSIFVDYFEVGEAIDVLDNNEGIIGFSLRLGENINYCYSMNKSQKMPISIKIGTYSNVFHWIGADYDFGYPVELSSSIYKTNTILNLIGNYIFINPNTLEALIDYRKSILVNNMPYLGCFENSVAFSSPMNLVQIYNNNRNSKKVEYSPDNLRKKYMEGYRIPLMSLDTVNVNSPHMEVDLL